MSRRRRTRVFSSPCCKVVSMVMPKQRGEVIPLAMCCQCFLVHDATGMETWLQDLLELPLGSPAPTTAPAGR